MAESHADYHQTDDHFCPACAFSSSTDDQLIAQLEFYFSQDNLIQDHYLRSQMDDENFVPILTICNFSKVKTFIENISDPEQFIANLVQSKSDVLQVCDLGLKIRAQSGPLKYRLVVRDVPVNYNREDVLEMFKTLPEAKVLSAEPTGCNSTWYIGFENENHSHAAMEHLKNNYSLKVHMKKVVGHPVSSRPAAQPAWPYPGPVFQPASPPIQQTWTFLPNGQTSPANQPVNSGQNTRPEEYQTFGAGNWTHLIRNPQVVRGGRNKNMTTRTMYQPFNRRGFGNQSESAVQGQGHQDMNNNAHYVKTYPNSNGKVHPKRRSPRPHRDHNGHLSKSYERKKPIGGSSTPDSEKTTSPVLPDPVPATPFELKQIEFPTLGPIATDSPTPPPPNSKEIFDDLKPANNKLADVLRTGVSPEPSLSKNQNPIAPPTQPPKTPKSKPLDKTPLPVPATTTLATWGPSSSRSIVETIKEKAPVAQMQQNPPAANSKSKINSDKIKTNSETSPGAKIKNSQNSPQAIRSPVESQPSPSTTNPTNQKRGKNSSVSSTNQTSTLNRPIRNEEISSISTNQNSKDESRKSDDEKKEDDGWTEVPEKPKRNPKKTEKATSGSYSGSRDIRNGSRDNHPRDSDSGNRSRDQRNRKNNENRKRKDYQRKSQSQTGNENKPVLEAIAPPSDLGSDSFGPSLVSGSNPFPVSTSVPLIPSSRWADVVTSK